MSRWCNRDDPTPWSPNTRFAALGRARSFGALAALAMIAVACLGVALDAQGPATGVGRGPSDLILFDAVVGRARSGEGYYGAMAAELRGRGYPTGSVFNWRPPFLLCLLAWLPGPAWGRSLVAAVALAAVATGFRAVERGGGVMMAACHAPLLFMALAGCFVGDTYLMGEVWAGALIALWAAGSGWPAVIVAGLAPFFRELAAPVTVIAAVLSWRRGKRAEAAVQAAGLVVFAIYFGVHAVRVVRHMPPAVTGPSDWVRLGGLRFLVATSSMNGLLILLPLWVTALVLPTSLIGLAGRRDAVADRALAAVLVYLGVFAVVGRPDNLYWGFLYAPLLTFGFVWAPGAVRDLVVGLRPRTGPPSFMPSPGRTVASDPRIA